MTEYMPQGWEWIVILLLFLLLGLNIGLPLILRKYYPNKRWVGILLCLFLGGGQLYLSGGLKYVIGLGILYTILKTIMSNNTYALVITILFSVGIINWRFLKLRTKPQQKEVQR